MSRLVEIQNGLDNVKMYCGRVFNETCAGGPTNCQNQW